MRIGTDRSVDFVASQPAHEGRNPSVEVLRILLMALIVFDHCCNHGPFKTDALLMDLSSATFFAVGTFAMISGWHGIRLTARKVLRLLGCGLFAALVLALLSPLAGSHFKFRFSLGWFGNTYLVLLLLSPAINWSLDYLASCGRRVVRWSVAGYVMVVFALEFLSGWVSVPKPILQFGVLSTAYLIGRVLLGCEWPRRVRFCWLLALVVLLDAVMVAWRVHGGACGFPERWLGRFFVYGAPHTMALSVCFFLLVTRIRFPVLVNRVALWMAPSMFSVYLLHDGTQGRVPRALYGEFEKILVNSGMSVVTAVMLTAVTVFCVCFCLDLVRRYAQKRLETLVARKKER